MKMVGYGIENSIGKIGGECFLLAKAKRSNLKLEYYLNQFDVDDYWILKSTNRFRLVDIEDLLTFKYAGFFLFKKSIFSKEWIEEWIEFLYKELKISIPYLSKPFPPTYIKTLLKTIETL